MKIRPHFKEEERQEILNERFCKGFVVNNRQFTDENTKEICDKFKSLINVSIIDTDITDISLKYLSQQPKLTHLFLDENALKGTGFVHFENHMKLQTLWLSRTQITDETLQIIANIPRLSVLRILKTRITFDGLMKIAHNPRIKVISDLPKEQIEAFEAKQRRLKKKKTMQNDNDIDLCKEVLLNFMKEMTIWEENADKLDEEDENLLEENCRKIFQKYCTNKKRAGFRPDALSWSGMLGGTYHNYEFIDSEQPSKNKIFIYAKNEHFDFRFTLVKIEEQWRIDEQHIKDGNWRKTGL